MKARRFATYLLFQSRNLVCLVAGFHRGGNSRCFLFTVIVEHTMRAFRCLWINEATFLCKGFRIIQ